MQEIPQKTVEREEEYRVILVVAVHLVLLLQVPHQPVVTEPQAQDAKVAVEVVEVEPLQALAAQEERAANLLAAAAEVEPQPTDQILEPVAQVVLV